MTAARMRAWLRSAAGADELQTEDAAAEAEAGQGAHHVPRQHAPSTQPVSSMQLEASARLEHARLVRRLESHMAAKGVSQTRVVLLANLSTQSRFIPSLLPDAYQPATRCIPSLLPDAYQPATRCIPTCNSMHPRPHPHASPPAPLCIPARNPAYTGSALGWAAPRVTARRPRPRRRWTRRSPLTSRMR